MKWGVDWRVKLIRELRKWWEKLIKWIGGKLIELIKLIGRKWKAIKWKLAKWIELRIKQLTIRKNIRNTIRKLVSNYLRRGKRKYLIGAIRKVNEIKFWIYK